MPDRQSHGRPQGCLLSFDYGKRRIGVAVGQQQTATATALGTVRNGKHPDWDQIAGLVEEWRPTMIVVGLPLAEDGSETPMSSLSREFGSQLATRYGIHVDFFDERLTSNAAKRQFAEMRAAGRARKRDADRIDAVAARIILENWLQSPRQ